MPDQSTTKNCCWRSVERACNWHGVIQFILMVCSWDAHRANKIVVCKLYFSAIQAQMQSPLQLLETQTCLPFAKGLITPQTNKLLMLRIFRWLAMLEN